LLVLAIGTGLILVASWLSPGRALLSFRQAAFLLLEISLCGPLLLSIKEVTGAGWLEPFQQICRNLGRAIPFSAVLFFLSLLASLNGPEPAQGLGSFREWWLNPIFLALRAALILTIWSVASRRLSDAFDNGSKGKTSNPHRRAVIFLVLFGPTFWIACVDWIMALAPGWQSTIFTFYSFSGLLLTAAAIVGIGASRLKAEIPAAPDSRPDDRNRDAANLLMFTSCFWAYLWFSQYMLIWYAGIPEESAYFIRRTTHGWLAVLVLALALNWFIPFLALLSRWMKTDSPSLFQVSLIVIAGRWIDLYQMILGDQGSFGLGQLLLDLGPTLLLVLAMGYFSTSTGGWVGTLKAGEPNPANHKIAPVSDPPRIRRRTQRRGH
jgi:hypothetical protein